MLAQQEKEKEKETGLEIVGDSPQSLSEETDCSCCPQSLPERASMSQATRAAPLGLHISITKATFPLKHPPPALGAWKKQKGWSELKNMTPCPSPTHGRVYCSVCNDCQLRDCWKTDGSTMLWKSSYFHFVPETLGQEWGTKWGELFIWNWKNVKSWKSLWDRKLISHTSLVIIPVWL